MRTEAQKAYNKKYQAELSKKCKQFGCYIPTSELDTINRLLNERGITRKDFIRNAARKLERNANKFYYSTDGMSEDEIATSCKRLLGGVWKKAKDDYILAKETQKKTKLTEKQKLESKELEQECNTFFDDGYGQEMLSMMGVHTSVKSILKEMRSENE